MKEGNMAGQGIDMIRFCGLAALELSPEKQVELKKQMEATVSYVQKIKEVNVDGVENTVYGRPIQSSAFREDKLGEMLDREIALKNSPQRVDNEFKVPRIVE